MNRARIAALGMGALLVAGAIAIVPSAVFAAGNNITVSPATTNTTTGGTFTVTVNANSDVAISGAGAALNFDKNLLSLTGIAKDATEVANGVSYAGFPTAANTASFIATANAAGQIPTIAWTYTDGSSFEAAGADHGIFSATFQVLAGGNSSLDPVIVPGVGGLLDGTVAGYGASLSPVTTASGAVVNPIVAPTPTPTPTVAPTPPPSAAPANGTTNVTGSLDAGFLTLSVPPSVTIPLVRNATNLSTVNAQILSNISWNLDVRDTNLGPNHGHMVSGANHLADSMKAYENIASQVNLEAGPSIVSTGANSANVAVTLSQFVAGSDVPGAYSISLLFQAISGF